MHPVTDKYILQNNANFQKWFGNSICKDDNGIVFIFYHRSRAYERFPAFLEEEANHRRNRFNKGGGIHFVISAYKHNVEDIADGIELYCYLKITNPMYFYPKNDKVVDMYGRDYLGFVVDGGVINIAKEKGHDGIIILNPPSFGGASNEYVVFESSQVKSIESVNFNETINIFE